MKQHSKDYNKGEYKMGGWTSTHVANGYQKTIYVKCDAERRYVTMANFSSSSSKSIEGASISESRSGGISLDWNKIQAGFSKILPKKYIKYEVDCSGTSTVYVSIVAEGGEVICDALPNVKIIA